MKLLNGRRVLHVWQAGYPWEVRVGKINRAIQASGGGVMVVCRHRGEELASETLDGVQIRRVGERFPRLSVPFPGNPLWRDAIARAIEEFRPDVMLVRDIPLGTIAGGLAKEAGIPMVLDMAEHYPEAMRSWRKYRERFLLKKIVHDWRVPDAVEKRVVAQAAGVIVVCEEQRERLIAQYGLARDRVTVVHNTPELADWRSVRDAVAARQGHAGGRKGPGDEIVFGYHGILCEDRALEHVLAGFQIAWEKDPRYRLLLAGGGESEAALRAQASALPARDSILFTGRYDPRSLPELYARCDFGIVSLRANQFTEHTLANKFFDYAALGIPFLYSDLTPLRSVMSALRCGVGFRPEDPNDFARAMHELASSNRSELSKSGIAGVESEFNWGVDRSRMVSFLARNVAR